MTHTEQQAHTTTPRLLNQWAVLAFSVSLAIRLFVGGLVLSVDIPLQGDELSYGRRAYYTASIIDDGFAGRALTDDQVDTAVENGIWTPLTSTVYSVVIVALGVEWAEDHIAETLNVLRVLNIAFSVLTTVLVYAVTRRLIGERAGLAAAYLHALHPVLIAFSHLLWSESLYIFLLFLTLRLMLAARRSLIFALLCGVCVGLVTLTRAAGVFYVVLIPLWMLFEGGTTKRIARSAVTLVVTVLVVAPWTLFLSNHIGRFALLTTSGDLNLYLGNNREVRLDFGAYVIPQRDQLYQTMWDYADERGIDSLAAARELAVEEIRSYPALTGLRAFSRLRTLWSSDTFVMRHVLREAYPPLSYPTVLAIWGAIIGFHLLLLGLALRGLLHARFTLPGYRWLLLLMVAAGSAPSMLTIVNTRLNLPNLALLLPLAGAGLVCAAQPGRWRRITLIVGLLLAVWVVTSTLPVTFRWEVQPVSDYYRPLADAINTLLVIEPPPVDEPPTYPVFRP